jgi:hypothetical protein
LLLRFGAKVCGTWLLICHAYWRFNLQELVCQVGILPLEQILLSYQNLYTCKLRYSYLFLFSQS